MPRRNNTITDEEKMFGLFYAHNEKRSKKARDVDNASTKGLTKDFAKMWVDPSRNDWAGIDTIVRIKPRGYTSKKGRDAFDNITDVLGASGFWF